MAKERLIPLERTGVFLKAALQTLIDAGGSLTQKQVLEKVEKQITFTETEKAEYQSGRIRWKNNLTWYSTDLARAGWINKKKGMWTITEAGRKGVELDPLDLIHAVQQMYDEWMLKEKQLQKAVHLNNISIIKQKGNLSQRKPPDPKSSPISSLIKEFQEQKLLLPEIQRSYVWKATKVRDLMDSIYRGYPAGSILIWETSGEYETKESALVGLTEAAFGSISLLLDGQQRLTSLATVMEGLPIRIKEGKNVREKQIELYFNLDHDSDFSSTRIDDEEEEDDVEDILTENIEKEEDLSKLCFHLKSPKISGNPHWIPVTKLFKEGIASILKYALVETSHPNYEAYFSRLNTLYNRKDNYYFPIQVLKDYDYDEVTEVFVRVNSEAMRLKGSDLALAQVTSRWRGAIKDFEKFIDEYSIGEFNITEGFLIRCIVAIKTGQSRFKNISRIPVHELKEAWEKVKDGLYWAKHFIQENAKIDSLTIVPSNYLIIPLVAFFSIKKGKLGTQEVNRLLYWFYSAAIWGRYSGSSETSLDQDLAALRGIDPINTMINNIKQQTGRLALQVEDIKERGAITRGILMMTYAVARHRSAKDWGNGLLINLRSNSKKFVTEFDHIFPQSKLDAYLRQTYQDDQQRKKLINEIANLVFLSKEENYPTKSNQLPSEYLPKVVVAHGEGALASQSVPTNQKLWELERFEDFLAERRKLLVQGINSLMEEIYIGESSSKKLSIEEIIESEENQTVEFKSSLRWDLKEKKINKLMEHAIAKTISAFMNSNGGLLLIGVDDSGQLLGLESDFQTLHKQNIDGFSLKLTEIINDYIGKEFNKYVHERYEEVDGKKICVVEVEASKVPTYVEFQGKTEFYMRAANSSQPLNVKEAAEYVKQHF